MFCCRIRRVSVSFPTQVRFSLSPDVRFLPGCSGRRILSCVRPSRADPAPALVGNYRAGTRSAAGVEAEYERQAVVLVTVSAGCDPARREGSRAPPSALRKPALYNWDEPARTTVGELRRDPGGPRRNRCVQLLGGSESGSDGGRRVRFFDRCTVLFDLCFGSGPGSDVERRLLFSSHWSRSA